MSDSNGNGRNIALTAEAGRLRAQGLDEPAIYDRLMTSPKRRDLPEREVRCIANSIGRKPPGRIVEFPSGGWPSSLHELANRRGWTVAALQAMGAIAKGSEVHFPMRDVSGKVTGWRQRRGDGQPFPGGAKALTNKGGKAGIIGPFPIPAEGPVAVCEGEADVAAALSAGHAASVGTPGATPGAKCIGELQKALVGRDVVLFPDPDPAGDGWRDKIGEALARSRCKVRFAPPLDGDLDRRLSRVADRAGELRQLIEGAILWTPPMTGAAATGAGEGDPGSLPGGFRPMTDLGNAERFAAQHKGKLLFDSRAGRWRRWDGRRWALNESGEAMRLAHKTARSIYGEAGRAIDSELAKDLAKHARKSEARDRLKAMIELAQSLLTVESDSWDADGWALNAANGTIDLRSGALRPHDPDDFITRLAPVDYDPAAKFATWDRVLSDALGEAETIGFLQRAAGYSATGDTREEKIFLPIGPEATCKSTIFEAIKAALGDYAATAGFDSFVRKQGGGEGPRNDIARLQGARFVAAIEGDEGIALADGLIKSLTGGDRITARFLYREGFEFTPTFKIWLVSNHPPRVRDDDGAMWRRIIRIPFERQIAKDRRDPNVKARLKDPKDGGPAILAWIVAGCLTWQKTGLGVPPLVERATDDYRSDQDPLRDFFESCCRFHPLARAVSKELRASYEFWAKSEGVHDRYLVSSKSFAERLKRRGCEPKPVNRQRGWHGVELCSATVGDGCNTISGNFPLESPREREVTGTDVASVTSVADDFRESAADPFNGEGAGA